MEVVKLYFIVILAGRFEVVVLVYSLAGRRRCRCICSLLSLYIYCGSICSCVEEVV